MGPHGWYCLKDGENGEGRAEPSIDQETDLEEDKGLYCTACGFRITSWGERISVDGAFEHTFVNPGGYVYRIGCFRQAPGCFDAEEPTDEHSWFKGCAWQYAVCGGCLAHLGWVYTSAAGERFHGLILDRLSSA
jgi:hypothetical protein